jgi:hypothetical protein
MGASNAELVKKILQSEITATQTSSFSTNSEFHPIFSFSCSLASSTAATYIFTPPTCKIAIVPFEHCEFSISYSDLVKFHYFADTTKRGDRD